MKIGRRRARCVALATKTMAGAGRTGYARRPPWQRHPLRDMRSGAVGLANNQEVACAQPRLAKHFDLLSCTMMEWVVNAKNRRDLFAGTM